MSLAQNTTQYQSRPPNSGRTSSKLSVELVLDPDEDEVVEELKVTFVPPLYLQRRIWILDVLRRESITDVVDIGCGEGQLLSTLCQPAPWLTTPPSDILTLADLNHEHLSPIDLFNHANDPIPNLHPIRIAGLDISDRDLRFAIEATKPPDDLSTGADGDPWLRARASVRWEDLSVQIWKGGLEMINENFVGAECIVSSEVIEHLPPQVLPFFGPTLLGVYQPQFFLVTTPSYKFNARFTPPTSPPSARAGQGYPDPTGRTDRIFRHSDHKFEWTPDEFKEYCEREAAEWGYELELGDIGRAAEQDAWGRDDELGGASLVATFRRIDGDRSPDRNGLERKARELVKTLLEQSEGSMIAEHELLVEHFHAAHEQAKEPLSMEEIGDVVKAKMEESRQSFMRLDELWFERDVSLACGGWIEVLIKAVESYEGLVLKKDARAEGALTPSAENNVVRQRELWAVEIIGGSGHPRMLWPSTEEAVDQDRSMEYLPPDFNPEEEYKSEYDYTFSSGEGDSSTGADGDISWSEDDDTTDESVSGWRNSPWLNKPDPNNQEFWNDGFEDEKNPWAEGNAVKISREAGHTISSSSSTAGWDGDESDDTTS
ncbi:hypothetical protein K435DRAFT_742234 [Dendrothele bispora CBS 962.96]|uniref:Small RNA 2'-O-methyltransferase n=1 Tax=Dendrothele bispora (strain CBS 962.96) TaxID=1314807 RepID=A0A4S8MW40_DENBC|nr:hypothetical protein K435DRAFT_742234 [Dendrothele bispora CBS 962.96]